MLSTLDKKPEGTDEKRLFQQYAAFFEFAVAKQWFEKKDKVLTYTQKFIDETLDEVRERYIGYHEWIQKERRFEYPYKDCFKQAYINDNMETYIDRWHEDE